MTTEKRTLSVLQFNAWLLAFPLYAWAKDYVERRQALPDALAASGADVLSLQEVWRNRDKEHLERSLRAYGYAYFHYTRQRFGLGDGMFLASKYPIRRIERGRPFRTPTCLMEVLAAKRVVAAAIDFPGIGEIDIYQTHMGSVVFDERTRAPNPDARKKLFVQLVEAARFIAQHRRSDFAVVTGDLNFHYQAPGEGENGYSDRYADEYHQFIGTLHSAGLPFEDSFLVANRMDVSHPAIPTFSQQNPYARWSFEGKPEETLDYVLFAPHSGWKVTESRLIFHEPINERLPALSDHYGIHTIFEFNSGKR